MTNPGRGGESRPKGDFLMCNHGYLSESPGPWLSTITWIMGIVAIAVMLLIEG